MRRFVVAALVVLVIPIFARRAEGGSTLAITHATFDGDNGTMTLYGANFASFGELEVWIGDICLTCLTAPSCISTPEMIECDLSGTPAVSAGGTWKVWVSACNAPRCKDEIHLSIATSVAACNSGDFVECYTGPAGTTGVGECVSGIRSCLGGEWGACAGEFVPVDEICNDGLDNDCDGLFDLQDDNCCLDSDGDGYGTGPFCLGLDCDDSDPDVPGALCDGPDSDACEEGVWECAGETAQCTDNTGDNIEICNGIDDDCIGGIDDSPGLCDDGLTCTFDICTPGGCVHDMSFGACLIEGVCYSNGQANPANACEYCEATFSPYDWQPLNCNDGDACTIDACDPSNGCQHTFVNCDDGLACTIDSCDSSSGACTQQSICNGSATFECPPTSPFGSSTYCNSTYYCSTATGQCEADNCCGP